MLTVLQYSNTVVFYGYSTGPSTKDITQIHRNTGIVGTPVWLTIDTPFRQSKNVFLKNNANKQNFIRLLAAYLTAWGITVTHTESDADMLIVQTAVEYSSWKTTYVIGEDTDLLVRLCFQAQLDSKKIFLRSDTKQAKIKHVWDIQKTQSMLTPTTCELLPFLHALPGCDTTSKIYGVSKPAALKLLSTNKIFQENVRSFGTSQSRQDVVVHS